MARLVRSRKACAVNPLKMSQPVGGALAFLGLSGSVPLLHGSQGCTSFGLVLFVRHFREAIPMQTTAMSEVATVLGGYENVEQAVANIAGRMKPAVIGILSTGVTEVKGDDLEGFVRTVRERRPELAGTALVPVSTPDFKGSLQDGWAAALEAMVEHLVDPVEVATVRDPRRINVLAGCHLTPGDVEEIKDLVGAFGLSATVLPDLSLSLDGHVPDDFVPTSLGGTGLEEIRTMGRAGHTIAVGRGVAKAAGKLERRTGVPFSVVDTPTGLAACDAFVSLLTALSGREAPPRIRRERSRLLDAMLDAHFFLGGRKAVLGGEPDLLLGLSALLGSVGCDVAGAVVTTESVDLSDLPCEEVLVGDLEDLERLAEGCDLMATHSHGRQAAERLGIPFWRCGIPMFDRLGAAHQTTVGYRGTRDAVFALGNLMLASPHGTGPETWRRAPDGTAVAVHAHS